jgi:hypothetical protein
MIATSMLTVFGYTGYVYLISAALLGLVWLWLCVKGFKCGNDKLWARKMFIHSLVIVTVISLMISVDFIWKFEESEKLKFAIFIARRLFIAHLSAMGAAAAMIMSIVGIASAFRATAAMIIFFVTIAAAIGDVFLRITTWNCDKTASRCDERENDPFHDSSWKCFRNCQGSVRDEQFSFFKHIVILRKDQVWADNP